MSPRQLISVCMNQEEKAITTKQQNGQKKRATIGGMLSPIKAINHFILNTVVVMTNRLNTTFIHRTQCHCDRRFFALLMNFISNWVSFITLLFYGQKGRQPLHPLKHPRWPTPLSHSDDVKQCRQSLPSICRFALSGSFQVLPQSVQHCFQAASASFLALLPS